MPLGAVLFVRRPGEKFAVGEEVKEERKEIGQEQNDHDREREILLGLDRPAAGARGGRAMKNRRDEKRNRAQA